MGAAFARECDSVGSGFPQDSRWPQFVGHTDPRGSLDHPSDTRQEPHVEPPKPGPEPARQARPPGRDRRRARPRAERLRDASVGGAGRAADQLAARVEDAEADGECDHQRTRERECQAHAHGGLRHPHGRLLVHTVDGRVDRGRQQTGELLAQRRAQPRRPPGALSLAGDAHHDRPRTEGAAGVACPVHRPVDGGTGVPHQGTVQLQPDVRPPRGGQCRDRRHLDDHLRAAGAGDADVRRICEADCGGHPHHRDRPARLTELEPIRQRPVGDDEARTVRFPPDAAARRLASLAARVRTATSYPR
ncbi:hypothetical protein PLANTIT3_70187 [Plantibacter sp. T3]|nr:hypothetical protein PLANTIT3_70187 [Plantibacter sp. T3]